MYPKRAIGLARFLIGALLFWGSALPSAHAASPLCSKALIWDRIATLKAQYLFPLAHEGRFTVYGAASSYGESTFSLVKLTRRTARDLLENIDAFERIGIRLHPYFDVVIEAHSRAIGVGDDLHPSHATPWIAVENIDRVYLPKLSLPRRKIGWNGFFGTPDAHRIARTLVLPADVSGMHAIEHRFAIAHEMAHLTPGNDENLFPPWFEARADFLAFVLTGIDEVRSNDGQTLHRSLKNPAVTTVSGLDPKAESYHRNSTLISGLLHRLDSKFGVERALGFVHWMDERSLPFSRTEDTVLEDFQILFRALEDWGREQGPELNAWMSAELRAIEGN